MESTEEVSAPLPALESSLLRAVCTVCFMGETHKTSISWRAKDLMTRVLESKSAVVVLLQISGLSIRLISE